MGRKVIEALPKMPKGATMISSYVDARQTGAWCIYETENPEEVKHFMEKNVPEMHLTDIVPLLQFFPPAGDVYKIMHIMSSL